MPKNKNPSTRFWNYEETPAGEPAVLRLEGVIASESWWGDEVTPAMFREELEAHPGDIVVYINSPGGDVFAGSQIYTMLMEHKGNVTVKIEGIAASAASVIAMAGTTVLIAPTGYMMIHCASSWPYGNKHELRHEADVLDEIDKGIRQAYHIKTGIRDSKLAEMMDEETWLSSRTAMELGFADGLIERDSKAPDEDPDEDEPDEDDALAADPDEDDEDDEDEDEEARMAAMLRRMPAVAWSPRRQITALRRQLRNEEVQGAVSRFAESGRGSSAEGGTGFVQGQSRVASANHKSLKALLHRDTADDKAADTERLKLQLLTL